MILGNECRNVGCWKGKKIGVKARELDVNDRRDEGDKALENLHNHVVCNPWHGAKGGKSQCDFGDGRGLLPTRFVRMHMDFKYTCSEALDGIVRI